MRDLYNVLDDALGSRECEDCRFFVKRKEYCEIPQNQGVYFETGCTLTECLGNPEECPVVLGYIQDYDREYAKAKENILKYIDPYDEQLAKHLAGLLLEEDTFKAALLLRAYLLELAEKAAEENV